MLKVFSNAKEGWIISQTLYEQSQYKECINKTSNCRGIWTNLSYGHNKDHSTDGYTAGSDFTCKSANGDDAIAADDDIALLHLMTTDYTSENRSRN